jgi:hypothetical protein
MIRFFRWSLKKKRWCCDHHQKGCAAHSHITISRHSCTKGVMVFLGIFLRQRRSLIHLWYSVIKDGKDEDPQLEEDKFSNTYSS